MKKAKKRNKTPISDSPSKFSKIALAYCDSTVEDDEDLALMANLLSGFSEVESLDLKTVRALGYSIERYLNRKTLRDHCYFGRPLNRCSLSDDQIKYEKNRISKELKNIF